MSQIKLRRDTFANFTTSNPVLGSGEPAYETDTKKLKIGDGSTAYTQLTYFSAGGGGGSDITATLPLKIENGTISLEVDGQTIQIVDGKLHANTDELGNEVNDLSGRVIANEADIMTIQSDITDLTGEVENKQNKLITNSPLVIAEQSGITLQQGVTENDTQYTRPDSGEGVVQVDLSPLNINPEDDWEIGLNLVNNVAGSGNCNAIEIINSTGTVFRIWNGSNKPRRGNTAETFESINYSSARESTPWIVKHVKGEDLYRFVYNNSEYSTTYTVAQMSEGLTDISTLTGQPKLETLKVSLSTTFLSSLKKNTNYTYVKYNNVTYPLVNLKSGDGISLSIGDGLSIVDNKLTATGGNNSSWTPSLLQCFWSDHLLNRADMLRADTFSWQEGTVYSEAYNYLLEQYNNVSSAEETEEDITYKRTPDGLKIALSTQETAISTKYNTDGIAWYYILDIDNTKFKLPRTKFGFKGLRANEGDDITESLPNITAEWVRNNNSRAIVTSLDTTNGAFKKGETEISGKTFGDSSGSYTGGSLAFDASLSNNTYQDDAPVQERATQMHLYFYVGSFSQTSVEQTAGLNTESFNNKADLDLNNTTVPHITETYINETSWYRIWSDGWCEQGGHYTGTNAQEIVTINLLKTFTNTNYNLQITRELGSAADSAAYYRFLASYVQQSKTTSSFQTWMAGNNRVDGCDWCASGYIS